MSDGRILVTGATGQLGGEVMHHLLTTLRVPPTRVVVAVRTPSKAAHLAKLGVEVREADYDKPESYTAALKGVQRLLLISSESEHRLDQHKAVIDKAVEAGVQQLVYTSIVHASTATMLIARDHKNTEEYIRQSQLRSYVLLRNGWYIENMTNNTLKAALQDSEIVCCSKDGRFAAPAVTDVAEAAAVVLVAPVFQHRHKTYELVGDDSFTMEEYAVEVSRASGTDVRYKDVSLAEYTKQLTDGGLKQYLADWLADGFAAATRGELDDESAALRQLIGRPTTPMSTVVQDAVQRMKTSHDADSSESTK